MQLLQAPGLSSHFMWRALLVLVPVPGAKSRVWWWDPYRQVRQPALDRLLDFRLLTVGSMEPDWEAHVHDRGGKWEIDGK